MKKRGKFLLVYGIIIVIILICILFVLPDSFFSAKYERNYEKYFGDQAQNNNDETQKAKFTDYEKQKKALLNGNYSYIYTILDSMTTKTYHYECEGTIKDDKESGSCSYPDVVSYTEESKGTVFKEIGTTYIDIKTIFNLIKDVEPTLKEQTKTREYTYNIKVKDLDTEVIIQTSTKEITQISINNEFMTYLLKYEALEVDN